MGPKVKGASPGGNGRACLECGATYISTTIAVTINTMKEHSA
jgi:hypothetical protein